ncbi:hypothetical protein ACGF0J_15415 [Nonomuraea sp. NPDC047897]|uniref:hypothetical protein n=1 Tax=Nonomuraea sp. NPDC047897 TaxID=3364346 RepID=UPI00371E7F67
MMRRLAAGLAAAALGATVLGAASAPALADPGYDGGQTRLQFDANPEPVWRGKTLSLEGKLSVQCDEDYISGFVSVHHADDCGESEKWHRLGWKRITILFKPNHSGRWHYVDSVRTSSDGYFHATARAHTSGTWKAVFDGSRGLEPAGATDYVKVIGRHH